MVNMPSLPSRRMRMWSSSKGTKTDATSPESEIHDAPEASSSKQKADTDGQSDANGGRNNGTASDDDKRRPLAADIKARKAANERFYSAAEAFHSYLGKKKPLPFELPHATALETAMALDEASEVSASTYPASSSFVANAAREGATAITRNKDKLLPVESLGVAMASIAATYGKVGKTEASTAEDMNASPYLHRNETFASHLGHLAGMQLALGRAQTEFAEAIADTMLSRLARMQATIESLRTAEKACESAREKMEIAEKKRDKAREKGEVKREMEEDARLTRATYEEAHDDVVTRVGILTETEHHGSGSGVDIVKEYISLYLEWVNKQQEILGGAQVALEQYQEKEAIVARSSAPHVRASPKAPAPTLPKRWDQKSTAVDRDSTLRSRSNVPPLLPQASAASIQTVGKVDRSARLSRDEPDGSKTENTSRRDSFSSTQEAKAGSINSIKASRLRSESLGKFGGRLTSALTRSSSSNELPSAAAPPKVQKNGSNEKTSSSWSSSLLSLKRDPQARSYKSVTDQSDARMLNGHERDLSHVREGTDQSYESQHHDKYEHDDASFGSPSNSGQHGLGPPIAHAAETTGLGVEPIRRGSDTSGSSSVVHYQNDTLTLPNSGLSAQWTGFSAVSSEGGDPFGGTSDGDPSSPHPFASRSDRIHSISSG